MSSFVVSCDKQTLPVNAIVNEGERLVRLMDSIPRDFAGWELMPRSGGNGPYRQSLIFSINLKGIGPGEGVEKLRSAIKEKLKEMNFHIIGGGESSSGNQLTGFAITVSDNLSIGTLVVSTAKINDEEMLGVLAVSQISLPSEPADSDNPYNPPENP